MNLFNIFFDLDFLLSSIHLIKSIPNQTIKLVVFVNILNHLIIENQVLKFTNTIRIHCLIIVKTLETLITNLIKPFLNTNLQITNVFFNFGFDFLYTGFRLINQTIKRHFLLIFFHEFRIQISIQFVFFVFIDFLVFQR